MTFRRVNDIGFDGFGKDKELGLICKDSRTSKKNSNCNGLRINLLFSTKTRPRKRDLVATSAKRSLGGALCPVDGYAVTGSTSSTDWGAICYELLGAIPDKINGGRIEMGCNIVQGNVRGDATEQSQNRRLPITTAIIGTISLSIFTSSSRPPIYISTHNEFQWTPYEDPAIRAVILDEFFQNPNVWHVKVPLVNYATMEMHQSDRVLRQFRF
ncbi:hypothetical protein PVK06_008627 [Gossypium arboreum]|uniref:Uncharacterized protein n=1 Tax=Gossypium arboreum TaxID=29729 RepID=A0ABR0QKK6_GOSAR|nr:hypothetical protein PVK06_008627 [Gossypium arboreum]